MRDGTAQEHAGSGIVAGEVRHNARRAVVNDVNYRRWRYGRKRLAPGTVEGCAESDPKLSPLPW